jgi:predicted lipoprotein with Yx(FWY)xxD motif
MLKGGDTRPWFPVGQERSPRYGVMNVRSLLRVSRRSVTGGSVLAGLLALAALTAGCGGAASGATAGAGSGGGGAQPSVTPTAAPYSPPVVISVRRVGKFGDVLVNSKGYPLYMFQPDHKKAVTCNQLCMSIWPPLVVPAGASVKAGPGVKQALLSSDPNPLGGQVATYDGWPLYAYGGDSSPGQATGQDVNIDGGYWFLMQPSGQPLMAGPKA